MGEHGSRTGGRHTAGPGTTAAPPDPRARPGVPPTTAVGAFAAAPTAPLAGARAEDVEPPSAASGADLGPDGIDDDLGDVDDEVVAPVRGVGWVLLIGGLVGAVIALVLLVEKLDLLANPDYVPSCSIDPVLSCGTIMRTAQASLLGFPNPVIGLLTFPVVAAMGALVVSRVELPRWCWWALQVGSLVGVAFIAWLIAQSLLVIHALCPYCMVAWVAVIAVFWFTTVHNLVEGNLGGEPAGEGLARRHGWGLAAFYLVVVVAIVASFPAYFGAMVGLA